ncbi:MAG TPA: hypothetical protein VFX97_14295 [Pyrinomonadaceae bacterium]|nr:hypothetical protein [Pyrinomonadaceae bacterium]
MKRCPECEFLYGDEQECCDMDGTVLRFTSFLPQVAPPQPTARKDLKSIRSVLAIPLLALIVIGSVLVTLYRAAPPKSSASSATSQPAVANEVPKAPVSDSPEVAEPASPAKPVEASPVPATHARDPFAKPSQPRSSANEKRITEKRISIEPATRVQISTPAPVINAPKPTPNQTLPAPAESPKAAVRSNTISVPPKPSPDKPTPQSKTQNQDKDSKIKSLFKKAGRILKKPF